MAQTQSSRRLELLAPAGDAEALEAALGAGADAVYFGLTTLNARRRARNLPPEELTAAVTRIHQRRARAYLALNTDLTERELGQAARMLELARQSGVDAVLIRDPAMLLLRPLFPQLEFHLSTQACAASRADATAARTLGLNRVVLARELTIDEIRAISAVPGVQTEVFVQGALCYCVSGRCLLSSWGGGRSGNRGLCTSPCRVPWRVGEHSPGHLLSMRDLGAMERLGDLARAGVTALKIEGRMKTAAWVREAVSLYRQALDGTAPAQLAGALERLGAYTGRQMTTGYLDGQRSQLTGVAGREAVEAGPTEAGSTATATGEPIRSLEYTLAITLADRNIRCVCTCGEQTSTWDLPRTAIRREGTATPARQLLDRLATGEVQGARLDRGRSDADAGLFLAPLTVRTIEAQLSAFLHRCGRDRSPTVRIDLPDALRRCLNRDAAAPANQRPLGEAPDRVRLAARCAAEFALRVPGVELVIEGTTAADLGRLLAAIPAQRLVIAMPPVVFEESLDEVRARVQECHRAGVTIEANTWGVGLLARMAGTRWESGPGVPVLNSLAARSLQLWGATGVTLSIEADRRQLEDVCRNCPAPASLIVYGRPALMVTRAELPAACLGQAFEDRRGIRMIPRLESGLAVYRPEEPFSIRHLSNPDIRVAHLVADLVAATDPVAEWRELNRLGKSAFGFNYNRSLA
jgi:collagenase-like PrtC family protease